MITIVTMVTMVTMVNTLKIRRAVTRLPIQGMSQQSCGHDPIGLSHYVRKGPKSDRSEDGRTVLHLPPGCSVWSQLLSIHESRSQK